MAIDFIPFEELFASDYQLTYISTDGYIDVGPYTYSVFHKYTMTERQQIFQVCKKHLPWEHTQKQEQWERTMYMYQFIIKSPPPFPYKEYPLNKNIVIERTEFLIYNKDHWMDTLTQEQIAEYVIKYPNFMDKYNARYQRGDVIEVRPDGYWTGPKAPGYDKNIFLLVIVLRLKFEDAKKYGKSLRQQFPVSVFNPETGEFEEKWENRVVIRRKYNFSNIVDRQVFNNVLEITIKDKTLG